MTLIHVYPNLSAAWCWCPPGRPSRANCPGWRSPKCLTDSRQLGWSGFNGGYVVGVRYREVSVVGVCYVVLLYLVGRDRAVQRIRIIVSVLSLWSQ